MEVELFYEDERRKMIINRFTKNNSEGWKKCAVCGVKTKYLFDSELMPKSQLMCCFCIKKENQ